MRSILITASILFLSLFGPTLQATADDCIDYGQYLHWVGGMDKDGASVTDIAVSGNVAYLLTNRFAVRTFRVVDISNPTAPVILADIPWTSGNPTAVAVSGSVVCVSDWIQAGSVFKVFDATNPSSPQLLGELDLPSAVCNDMTIVGSLVYIADYNQAFLTLSIADPSHPTFLGQVATPAPALKVVVQGAYAYVADDYGGLIIISVFDPLSPSIVSILDTPGNVMGMAISGTYAYVADGPRGLQVVDITDLTSPLIVGNLNFGQVPVTDAAMLGPTLYAATTDWGIVEVDVSTPSAPIPGARRLAWHRNVDVFGTMMFTHGGSLGYAQFDNPRWHSFQELINAATVGSVEVNYPSFVAAVSGSIAYLSNYGVTLADVSDPSSPQLLGTVDLGDYVNDVAVFGSIAYAAANAGLVVLDVSDPQAPSVLGTVPGQPDDWTASVEVDETTCYVANYPGGLKIFDLTDQVHPTLISTLGIPCQDVTLSGSWAYLACDDSVLVVNVTNPGSPQVVGSVKLPTWANDIIASGSMLYAADDVAGLQIVDVSNPTFPVLTGGIPLTMDYTYANSVAAIGTYVYLGTGSQPSGIEVIDASQPDTPRLVGNLDISGNFAVVASGSSLYLVEAHNAPDGSYPNHFIVARPHCPLEVSGTPPSEPKPLSNLLGFAHPNPVLGGGSAIPFTTSRRGLVTLRILDVAGREVRTLVHDVLDQGSRSVVWDGRGSQGGRVPAGIYFYQLRAPGFEATRKLVRIQ